MIVLDQSWFPGILWSIATNKEAIWQELPKFKSKKYEKVSFLYISKALMSHLGVPTFQGSKYLITEQTYVSPGQKITIVVHIWATLLNICIFGYSGDPGWPFNNQTGPILPPRYPLTYVNLHAKYGNNPRRIFKVIVRTMKYLRNVIQC